MHKQLLFFLITILSLASCGTDSKHFKIEGRILNMNQGEFYVYDDHGFISGIDTIKVEGGRFVYKMECERPTTVMLVFPNFSEQPIFAESSKSVTIKGDASHLKMLSVKGTSTNELMTKFREQVSNASPPETKKYASRFIEDHPKSLVAPYLLKKYFINTAEPNFKEAYRLLQIISVKQPNNVQLTRLSKQIDNLRKSTVGNPLPTFTAYDMKGKLVSSSDLSSGLAVICAWASWSYESTDQLRYIQRAQKKSQGRLKTVSISLDASRRDCKNVLDRDSIPWPNICDGKIFESKPIQLLGLTSVPDNILIKNGKIIARSLSTADLQDTIEKNL